MRSIGSFMLIVGLAAIVFGFLDSVPRILFWIYNWGNTTAWIIKIALVVVGLILMMLGSDPEEETQGS